MVLVNTDGSKFEMLYEQTTLTGDHDQGVLGGLTLLLR